MVRASLLLAALLPTAAGAALLYDGASGVLPEHADWGWSYAATGGSHSAGGGVATLDTMGNVAFSAGWGRVSPIDLDPAVGFNVRFDLQIEAEDHSPPGADKNNDGLADRAGFSVIVLGADARGVELGFWGDEVWAQQDSPLFTHSPVSDRAFLDTGAMTRYDISMLGGAFELRANGTLVMSGVRKDYTAFTGFPDPYETPNFLFFGDDTASASGRAHIAYVEATAVPEPATLAALASGVLALRRRRGAREPLTGS